MTRRERIPVSIRWMLLRDMPDVMEIEQDSFPNPWPHTLFTNVMRRRSTIGMVAEFGEQVAGFMIYEIAKSRLHVLNFAVRREFRRRGIGTGMAAKLVGKLSRNRRPRIVLEVGETNLPAQQFFRAMGFRAISILHGFYEETDDDAYVMQYDLNPSAIPVNRINARAAQWPPMKS